MADRPILFSGAMVRALLAGNKTQTRRIIKPQPTVHENGSWHWEGRNGGFVGASGTHVDKGFPEVTKHWNRIQPGDRLWVRETWSHTGDHVFSISEARMSPFGCAIYQADDNPKYPHAKFWPSIHLPREFSRMTLIVTDVRVERLQDISVADAIAEGIEQSEQFPDRYLTLAGDYAVPKVAYQRLWETINGPGSWAANPWVAAYTFRVIKQNIDQIEREAA